MSLLAFMLLRDFFIYQQISMCKGYVILSDVTLVWLIA